MIVTIIEDEQQRGGAGEETYAVEVPIAITHRESGRSGEKAKKEEREKEKSGDKHGPSALYIHSIPSTNLNPKKYVRSNSDPPSHLFKEESSTKISSTSKLYVCEIPLFTGVYFFKSPLY